MWKKVKICSVLGLLRRSQANLQMNRYLIFFFLITGFLFIFTRDLKADCPTYDSNKGEKKEEVRSGNWKPAFGRELTETDVIQGAIAVGCSIYSGNSACVMAWIDNLINESIIQMRENIEREFTAAAQAEAERMAVQIIRNLLSAKSAGVDFRDFGNFGFKAGVIEYSGRNQVWIPNPLSRSGGYCQFLSGTFGWIPYVALRWRGPSSGEENVSNPAPSTIVLQSNPRGSGTNWSITNNGGSSKIQNLGNSQYRDRYLDINGN